MDIEKICKSVIISEKEIDDICTNLGKRISDDYKGEEVIMIGLLNGCNPFFSDLIKKVDLEIKIDYIKASSYHGTIKSSNEVKILKDLDISIKDKHVIVVDDIIDTGTTIKCIIDLLKLKGAKDVEVCVMLEKSDAKVINYVPKYIGTKIPKVFVVGYGLDYAEHYRNLPYIGELRDELIKEK